MPWINNIWKKNSRNEKFTLEGCPQGKGLYLNHLQLFEINLNDLPPNLEEFSLGNNFFEKLNLIGLPQSLRELYLSNNLLEKINLNILPSSLRRLYLNHNHLKEINFSNLPQNLLVF